MFKGFSGAFSLENNISKLIHTSTSEVYGTADYVPIDENGKDIEFITVDENFIKDMLNHQGVK